MYQNYVVGFAFDADLSNVVLIEKNRPSRLAGLLNGIGGEIEQDETSFQAMCREFEEETGVITEPHEWHLVETLYPDQDIVLVYCMANDKVMDAATTSDEKIVIMGSNLQEIATKAAPDVPKLLLNAVARLAPDYLKRKHTL